MKQTSKLLLIFFLTKFSITIKNIEQSYIRNVEKKKDSLYINRLCYEIRDFNERKSNEKTGHLTLESALNDAPILAEGDFGVLKALNYGSQKAMVKIQIFESFDLDDIEFWASNNELKNLYLINQAVKKNQNFMSGNLHDRMIINLYGCVYDTHNKTIYYFIDKLYDTLKNQRYNFLKQTTYERFIIYRIMIYDIRKIHLKMRKVHLDIKPNNIMSTNILLSEKGTDENLRNRMKIIDYGLMSDIGTNIEVFNKEYAHPDLINNPNMTAQPYLDIFSLLLTFAEMEYGSQFIKTDNDCHIQTRYSEYCFNVLKKNIILGYCLTSKECGNEDNLVNYVRNYVPANECKDLACFIYKILQYDGSKMQARLDKDEEKSADQTIIAKDMDSVLDACPENKLNAFLAAFKEVMLEEKHGIQPRYYII